MAGAETLRLAMTAKDEELTLGGVAKATAMGAATGLLTAGISSGCVGAGMNAVLGKEVVENLGKEAVKELSKEVTKKVAVKAARKATTDAITGAANTLIYAGADAIKEGDMSRFTKKLNPKEMLHETAKSVVSGQVGNFVEFAGKAGTQVFVEQAAGQSGDAAGKALNPCWEKIPIMHSRWQLEPLIAVPPPRLVQPRALP